MNRLVEYIIEAKDRTAAGIQSAMAKVKQFGDSVSSAVSKIGSKLNGSNIDEKFIRTTAVLDSVGRALDRMGVSGEQFNDVYDTLERRLNSFNQTGKGAAELMEHFRRSMEDVGMSAKQIDNGIAMLKRNMVGVGTSGSDVAKDLKSGFRGVHSVISALQGNTMAAGRAFTWLLGHIKGLKVSASALSAISIGVFALTEVVSKAVSWWKEKKRKMEEIQQMRFENTLRAYGEAQKEVNRELKQGNREIENEVARKKLLIETNSRLMQQELEMARVKALEGTSGAERDAVNRDFDAQAAALKARTEIEKAQVEAAGQTATAELLGKLKARLEPQKAKMEEELKTLEKEIAEKDKEGEKLSKIPDINVSSMYFEPAPWTEEDAKNKFENWKAEDEEYKKLKEKRDRLKSQYDGIVDDIEDFADRKHKAELKAQSLQSDAQNTEAEYNISVWKEEEQALHDFYEDMEEAAENANRELERQARERARVEMELRREALRDAQQNVAELVQSQRAAYAQLSDAQNKVKEAWGFYKDSGSMQSYIAEQTREMEARKQYEKDIAALERGSWSDELTTAKRLNRRGETDKLEEMFAKWRSGSFGLSVEQEATMRVAVAKDEEKQAQKALEEISEQMSEAMAHFEHISEAIANIEGLLEEGGE